jgi:hypothetical protein
MYIENLPLFISRRIGGYAENHANNDRVPTAHNIQNSSKPYKLDRHIVKPDDGNIPNNLEGHSSQGKGKNWLAADASKV